MTALIARREALAARLATLTPRSIAAIRCRIELEWVTNDLLRMTKEKTAQTEASAAQHNPIHHERTA